MSEIQRAQPEQPTKAILVSRSPVLIKRTTHRTQHGAIFHRSFHPQLTVVFAKGHALLTFRYQDLESCDGGGSEWSDHSFISWAMGCLDISHDALRSVVHWRLQARLLDSVVITACLRSATSKTSPRLIIHIVKGRLHNPLIYSTYALLEQFIKAAIVRRRCSRIRPSRCVHGMSRNAFAAKLLTVSGTQQDRLLLRKIFAGIASKHEPLPEPDPGTPPRASEPDPAARALTWKAGIHKATAASISKATAVQILPSRYHNSRPLFNSRYSCPTSLSSAKWKRQTTTRPTDMPEAFWALTYLRVLASHNLESQPELLRIFDRELSCALEDTTREARRTRNLADQVTTAKNEVKAQALMISGLVRERSSMQLTAEKTSVVSNLQYTIEHMRKNETEMTRQIQSLKAELSSRNSQVTENLAYEQTGSKRKSDQHHSSSLLINIDRAEESSPISHNSSACGHDQEAKMLNGGQTNVTNISFHSPPSSHDSVRLSSIKRMSAPSPSNVPRSVSSPTTFEEDKDEGPWKNLECPGPQARAIHKQLMAERDLNIALEEAVTELENQTAKLKSDNKLWADKLHRLQLELDQTREKLRPFSERQAISEQIVSAPIVTKRSGVHQKHLAETAQRNLERKIDKFKKSRRKGGIFKCF